jgi:hypothetical protein
MHFWNLVNSPPIHADLHVAFFEQFSPRCALQYIQCLEMFILSIIKVIQVSSSVNDLLTTNKDTMSVHPSHFGVPTEQALISEINKKYANRVMHEIGLCICVFDLVEAGEGKVRYGDGFLWYKGTSCYEDLHTGISPIHSLQLYSEW